jgi:putative endonuclease
VAGTGVYILQSDKNKSYYIGSTIDIGKRLYYHNSGWVRATKNNKPFELVRFIPCRDLTEAKRAEYRFKKYKRRDIIERTIRDGIFPWEYNEGA